jgi:ketosteroid isomerase-like protein
MSLLVSISLLLLGSIHVTDSNSTQTADPVMLLEQRFTAALLKRDAAELNDLLADDLVHVSFEGQIAGKSEYMEFFKHGSWQYRKYEPTNIAVKLIGSVAVVTGRVQRTIVVNDKETTGAFTFTHVWSRAGDRWHLTSSHVTSVPNPSPAAQ